MTSTELLTTPMTGVIQKASGAQIEKFFMVKLGIEIKVLKFLNDNRIIIQLRSRQTAYQVLSHLMALRPVFSKINLEVSDDRKAFFTHKITFQVAYPQNRN